MLASVALVIAAGLPQACDTTAIRWVTPGDFHVALKRSEQEKRLIAIKGIAFGVDEAGAKKATKGCW